METCGAGSEPLIQRMEAPRGRGPAGAALRLRGVVGQRAARDTKEGARPRARRRPNHHDRHFTESCQKDRPAAAAAAGARRRRRRARRLRQIRDRQHEARRPLEGREARRRDQRPQRQHYGKPPRRDERDASQRAPGQKGHHVQYQAAGGKPAGQILPTDPSAARCACSVSEYASDRTTRSKATRSVSQTTNIGRSVSGSRPHRP